MLPIFASGSTEPETGINFPPSVPLGATELTLLGLGVRVKRVAILDVKVYAVGLYAEAAVLETLATFKGGDFFKALAASEVNKSIQIVLARDVDGQQFFDALNEALNPRLAASGAGAEGETALAAFGSALKDRKLKKNTGISLSWILPATLQVSIAEDAPSGGTPEAAASIQSLAFLEALYDVYLGENAVSESLKSSIAGGFKK